MNFDKSNPVKLRLLMDIPVATKYGLTMGSEIVAYPEIDYRRGYPRWWYYVFQSAMLDPVGILSHEAEEIK